MKEMILAIPLILVSGQAQASGGLVCRTAGARPLELAMVISHTAVSTVVSARLADNGRQIPVAIAQSWIERNEVRLDLTDMPSMRHELRLRARRDGSAYEGSVWRSGQRRWVRCREG